MGLVLSKRAAQRRALPRELIISYKDRHNYYNSPRYRTRPTMLIPCSNLMVALNIVISLHCPAEYQLKFQLPRKEALIMHNEALFASQSGLGSDSPLLMTSSYILSLLYISIFINLLRDLILGRSVSIAVCVCSTIGTWHIPCSNTTVSRIRKLIFVSSRYAVNRAISEIS